MAQLFDQMITVQIISLTEKGYGEGEWDGRTVRVLGALPGETVTAVLFRKTKGVWYGRAEEVIEVSPHRTEAIEDHYQSCSPWQILALEEECRIKQDHIQSYFAKEGVNLETPEIVPSANTFRYRNKLEFSFYVDEAGELQLAFNKRGSKKGKSPVEGCVLAPEVMNEAVRGLRDILRKQNVPKYALKTLQVRYSFTEQSVILMLFITNPEYISTEQEYLAHLPDEVAGVHLFYSDSRSPASTFTEHLMSESAWDLEEDLGDVRVLYPAHGFFQVNPSAFKQALNDIRSYISRVDAQSVLDLYAGVGALSVPLAVDGFSVTGVEIFPEAKTYAEANARKNGVAFTDFREEKAEVAVKEILEGQDVLLLDPPRSGLHPKILKRIREYEPPYIVYLSCNPKTQAKDIAAMPENYEITFTRAYNFYPHTPHVEHLVCLERR